MLYNDNDVPKKRVSVSNASPSVDCSCTQCESIFCFRKRHFDHSCSCAHCQSKSCLGRKLKDCKSDEIIAVYLNAAKSKSIPRQSKELNEYDLNYETDRNKIILSNLPPPKSLDEYIDRLFSKTPSERIGTKAESLNEYIDLIKGKNINALKSYIKDLKQRKSIEPYRKRTVLKCNCCRSMCAFTSEIQCPKQADVQFIKRKDFETEVRSVMLSGPNMDHIPSQQSKGQFPDKSSSGSIYTANNSIFKYDIFAKIKEAYNACSCIVCDCIPTMKDRKDVCSCKPCECPDCKGYLLTSKCSMVPKQRSGLKYTPSQYISQCLTKKPKIDCSCKPCDCALCQKSGSEKPCDCDQCQCDQCKPTLLAGAPSGDKKQNAPCQCAPCQCTECVRGYINVSKNSLLKTSIDKRVLRSPCHCEICPNDICAVGAETCNCKTVFKKNSRYQPQDKEFLDFDTQTALILNDIHHHTEGAKRSQDMIAMYSALPRTHNYASNSVNTKMCNCEECECLTCVCKEDTINAIKSSQLFTCHMKHSTPNQNSFNITKRSAAKVCECAPCECQVCHNQKYQKESYHVAANESFKSAAVKCSCKCNACLCSDTSPQSLKRHTAKCRCTTCRCERCFGEECTSSNRKLNRFPIKTGEVMTPLAHQKKIQKFMIAKGNLPALNVTNKQRPLSKNFNSFTKSEQAVVSHARIHTSRPLDVKSKPSFTFRTVTTSKTNTIEIGTGLVQTFNKYDIFKYDAYVQCRDWTNTDSVEEINLTDKISESYISVYASTETISKTSICKENDTATSISGHKVKSLESSCNSSGYDHPRYLIRFPKTTAETCLEDVMKGNLENNIKLDALDSSLKRNKEWLSENKNVQSSVYNVIKPATSFSTTLDTKGSENFPKYESRKDKCNATGGTFYYEPYKSEFSKKSIKHIKTQSNIIEHNTESTTANIGEIMNGHDSINTKNQTKSSPNMNNNSRGFNYLQNQSHTTRKVFTCFNLSDEKINRDENTTTKAEESSYALFGYNVDSLDMNVDEDYKRVKKTIKEANEFSMKLLRLLESYEKANKEFKKISDILQISQASFEKNNEFSKKHEISKAESEKFVEHMARTTRFEEITPWSVITETKIHPNEIGSEKGNFYSVNSHKNQLGDLNRQHTNVMFETPERNNVMDKNDMYPVYRRKEVTRENQTSETIDDRPCKDNEYIQTVRSNKRHKLNLVLEMLDPILGNAEKDPMGAFICQSDSPSVNELQLQTEELSVITIPPSNNPACDECQYQRDIRKFTRKSKIEYLQPQKIDKLVGEPLSYKDKGVSCGDVENMEDLESTVKELLNEFVLQPLEKEKLISESIKEKSSYFCAESLSCLKVNFLLVRKVSDHTVLVKWSQPWDLSAVQGYELLVDGRAVQKIFNPSKCIAVVTCLPHTDKILLTIRTVTTIVSRCGHSPATTIIYRPRVRKQ